MKKYSMLVGVLLIANHAFADTWECVDSTDGHKYRVSQNVQADLCTKIDNVDHYLDSLPPEVRNAVLEMRKPRSPSAQILDVEIGMTSNDVRRSLAWGAPDKINKTVTARGTSEQWVYKNNQYLYFENNILTAIQK